MIKETVSTRSKQTQLTITNNSVSAILRSDVTKTGIRLYDNGCLGIAGAIGNFNENELESRARQMLKFKMAYNAAPTENNTRSEDLSGKLAMSDAEVLALAEEFLSKVSKSHPRFTFNHKITLAEDETSLKNSVGTCLTHKDKSFQLFLTTKHKDSKNLMDGFVFYMTRDFCMDKALAIAAQQCENYEQTVDFSTEDVKIPVVFNDSGMTLGFKFMMDLRGDAFANGATMLSGKTGEKLFSENFSLLVNRDVEKFTRFFDGEGVTLPKDSFALIENGVLKAPYTSKRIAKQYDLPITGSASLEYDAAPDASPEGFTAAESDKTLLELLAGRKAIYIESASGGDYTPQGEYASPIQVAYLYEDGKCLGRLPQLSMTSNLYDIFGKDYIGLSTDSNYADSPYRFAVTEMNVKKIDGWM